MSSIKTFIFALIFLLFLNNLSTACDFLGVNIGGNKSEIEKFVWSKRQKRMIECSLCMLCWKENKRATTPNDDSTKQVHSWLVELQL